MNAAMQVRWRVPRRWWWRVVVSRHVRMMRPKVRRRAGRIYHRHYTPCRISFSFVFALLYIAISRPQRKTRSEIQAFFLTTVVTRDTIT